MCLLAGCQLPNHTSQSLSDYKEIYQPVSDRIESGEKLLSLTDQVQALDLSYYDEEVQASISDQIKNLQAKHKSYEDGLFIMNPFGTLTQSIYTYLPDPDQDISKVTYSIESETSDVLTFEPVNYSQDPSAYEFTMIGLVPNEANQLTVNLYDADDNMLTDYQFQISAPDIQATDYETKMEVLYDSGREELTDGFYASMGSDQDNAKFSYLYDNNGLIRSELVSDGARLENYQFLDKQHLLVRVSNGKLAVLNGLGQPVRIYELPNHSVHHDFIVNEKKDAAFLLTTNDQTDTIEDTITYLDLRSGESQELIDLKAIFPNYFQPVMATHKNRAQNEIASYLAAHPDQNYSDIDYTADSFNVLDEEGNLTNLDWIHINAIDVINGDELILSSRETSSLIKLSNVFDQVTVDYIIGPEAVWAGTGYEYYLLTPDSDFKPTGGQHSVRFQSNAINDGFYNLTLFDNNYWRLGTRDDLVIDLPQEMSEEFDPEVLDTYSYFYNLQVDEASGTYDLVQAFPVPYSSIVSSAQVYKGNYITTSGMTNILGEYNPQGELIRQFQFYVPRWTYRLVKLDLQDFFYENIL
ncbi:aryl-sulfate sulfotransferase [Aerococcus sp. Group 2]|uniref:aryl-sulfate sulfotransferase n=1 Tax=Aerococcus sp. Group 2 TaxID=2976811 RepID=UPI00227B9BEE|nr:aryl-sulfate sulfotransferase [Aerococcus sp. Group 2]MCY3036357.1 aryl-sulfate sulfotransferase [Aerococcus sp. Group 2]